LRDGGNFPETSRWHSGDGKEAWQWTYDDPERQNPADNDGLLNYLTDPMSMGGMEFGTEMLYSNHETPMPRDFMVFPDTVQAGDVVFYDQHMEVGTRYNHTAIVVGWGPAGEVHEDFLDKGGQLSPYNTGGLVPWIAEGSGAEGHPRIRAINNTHGHAFELLIVHVFD
jgi:hypothetical protein